MAKKNNNNVKVAYESILEAIVTNTLLPRDIISVYPLAAQLGMSRTPVREAVLMLIADGLIETDEEGKSRVTEIGYRDIMDIHNLRRVLEIGATRAIIENGGLTQAQSKYLRGTLQDTFYQIEPGKRIIDKSFDGGFHSAIIKYSKNKRMIQVSERLNLQMLRTIWVNVLMPDRQGDARLEHEAILNALEEHDYNKSIDAIKVHYDNNEKVFHMFYNDADMRRRLVGIRGFIREIAPMDSSV